VEKSRRLNWATQFLMVVYDGTCFPYISIRMALIFFGALPSGGGGIYDSSRLYFEIVCVAVHASFQPL
jgi:hypothetical protein